MTFSLPPLPYGKDAFGDVICAETFEYHHGKHHQAYIDKTNELAEKAGLSGQKLSQVIAHAQEKGDRALFNNSAQAWNHSFFWQCLTPGGAKPSGDLAQRISRDFGSTEALIEKLKAESAGHFGSGWGWLVLDGETLKVTSFHDGDTPLVHGLKPVLTVDVWEHAYYIDYRNARPKYLDAVLNGALNWEFAAQNLDGRGVERADQ